MGGGTAVDDGVRSQVGELSQGCHEGRGVCGTGEQWDPDAATMGVPVGNLLQEPFPLPSKPTGNHSQVRG